MPIYTYACDTCEKSFDYWFSVDDRDSADGYACPFSTECTGVIHRMMARTSFRLSEKGNHGWASNGYADNVLGNDPHWRKENGLK